MQYGGREIKLDTEREKEGDPLCIQLSVTQRWTRLFGRTVYTYLKFEDPMWEEKKKLDTERKRGRPTVHTTQCYTEMDKTFWAYSIYLSEV